jgi:hypothetical protein
MNFMGALKSVGSGFKHAGGAIKKSLNDPEKMAKYGRMAEGFGQAAGPDSQIGKMVGSAGRGMVHGAAHRMTSPDTYGGAKGAGQSASEQMQREDVTFAQMPPPPMEPPPGFGAPMEAPYMPPDVEMDEQGNYRRKGGVPLQY